MTTRNTPTPMLTQSRSIQNQFPIEGMRLLDGPSAEEVAAAAAAEVAAAKVISDKKTADEVAAAKVISDAAAAAEAEAARIAASKLSASEAALLKDSMAHKAKAAAAQTALDAANLALEAFKGIDPTKAKELLAAQKVAEAAAAAAEEAAAIKAGEWDRLKTQMAATHKTELEAAQGAGASNATALAAALATIDDLTVGSQFNTSPYVADELVLTPSIARTVYGSHFDTVNGATVGHDKPRGAKDRTPLVDASGNPLKFDDAMKKLIEASPDKDRLVKSGIKAGARSATREVKSGTTTRDPNELRGMARIAAGLAAGGLPQGPK
jgi:hypothetical protein